MWFPVTGVALRGSACGQGVCRKGRRNYACSRADVEAGPAQGYQPQEDEVGSGGPGQIRAGRSGSGAARTPQDEAYWEEYRAQIVSRQSHLLFPSCLLRAAAHAVELTALKPLGPRFLCTWNVDWPSLT